MRSEFSNQKWLTMIRKDPIDQVQQSLSYFMWETSTDTMMRIGVPTNDDVHEWILCLENRPDKDDKEVQWCITDCNDYITGTMNAFSHHWRTEE